MKPVDFLLLRGLARESGHWADFPDNLKKQNYVKSVTCIDLPGAGEFHKLTAPLTIQENAEFVLSQIPKVLKGRPVVLSVSLGAMVALEMALRQPEQFCQIYTVNTSFANLSPFYHRLQLASYRRFFKILRSPTIEGRELEVLKMISNNDSRWDELSKAFALVEAKRPMAKKNFFRQLIAAATYRLPAKAPEVPITVLNSAGDRMVDPSCSEKLASHWGLPILTHPTAGHDIPIDGADWIFEKVRETIIS